MDTETILVYGIPAGETERYREELLAESCTSQIDVDCVIEAASIDGFHSFRVTTWDGSKPDFTTIFNREESPNA